MSLRDHLGDAWFRASNGRAGMAVRNRAYVIRHFGSGPAMSRVRNGRAVRALAPRTPVVRNRIDRATGRRWSDPLHPDRATGADRPARRRCPDHGEEAPLRIRLGERREQRQADRTRTRGR